MSFLESLGGHAPVIAVELRPPRAELGSLEGMDAWIDTYHAVRALTRLGFRVFLTDSAVGTQEENNLRHLVTNLGGDVSRDRVIPFLTSKHSLEFCHSYAEQASQHGFSTLVVLGGDKTLGRPRCVEHAWQLRADIRRLEPRLTLGGWTNPYGDAAAQVDYLLDPTFTGEFYLTQIVSHLNLMPVRRFIDEVQRRYVTVPGMFGVFYYRSMNPRTLALLSDFLPVPAEELAKTFAAGATPVDVCAKTIRTMMDLGVRHFYISNLPTQGGVSILSAILERVGVAV